MSSNLDQSNTQGADDVTTKSRATFLVAFNLMVILKQKEILLCSY